MEAFSRCSHIFESAWGSNTSMNISRLFILLFRSKTDPHMGKCILNLSSVLMMSAFHKKWKAMQQISFIPRFFSRHSIAGSWPFPQTTHSLLTETAENNDWHDIALHATSIQWTAQTFFFSMSRVKDYLKQTSNVCVYSFNTPESILHVLRWPLRSMGLLFRSSVMKIKMK